MTSRDSILNALRKNAPPLSPLPEPPAAITYPDPVRQFEDAFTSVGGKFVRASSVADINAQLLSIDGFASAQKVISLVPGVANSTIDALSLNDPHQLEGIQYAILQGEFGVAENGAVWIPGSTLGPHRAVFVIAEDLVLVVPANQIVNTMHDAYARVKMERPGFGLFISGPSKTADIEQSLVIGAHGPRSCTLFLIG